MDHSLAYLSPLGLSSLPPAPQAHLHPSEDEETDRRKYTSYRHEDLVEEIIYIKTFVQKFETVANESKAVAQRVSTGVRACVRACLCVHVRVCVLYMRALSYCTHVSSSSHSHSSLPTLRQRRLPIKP